METPHRETRRHLDLLRRQIEGRAERITVTRKPKATNRSHRRAGCRWTRSDEILLQSHLERLAFERRAEIEALSRKLARQEAANISFRVRHGRHDNRHHAQEADPVGTKRHDRIPPLTKQEEAALEDYAARHGRSWKRVLNDSWMGEKPHDDGPILRKLRNTHGPTWLDRYRLPKRPVIPERIPAEDL